MQSICNKITQYAKQPAFGPPAQSATTLSRLEELVKHRPYRAVIFVLAWIYWFWNVTRINKIAAAIFSSCFSFVEYFFVMVTSKDNKGGTTAEQWMIHTLIVPYFGPWFLAIVPNFEITVNLYFYSKSINMFAVILAPLFAWSVELAEGYFLIFIFGWNNAWQYFDSDAYFHGTIKLGYAKYWIIAAFFVHLLLKDYIYQPDVLWFS